MRQLQRCRQYVIYIAIVWSVHNLQKTTKQVSHEYASDNKYHFSSHRDTLFLREISAIEMKCIHFKHKFNELEKSRCGHRLFTALIEKMFTGFQSSIMRDRSI